MLKLNLINVCGAFAKALDPQKSGLNEAEIVATSYPDSAQPTVTP